MVSGFETPLGTGSGADERVARPVRRRLVRQVLAAAVWASSLAHGAAAAQTVRPAGAAAAAAPPEKALPIHCARPVVYVVLSPRMPYALQEWPRMQRAAEAAGFTTIGLRDPRVPDAEWHAAVRAADVPSAQDLPVLQAPAPVEAFGALNHFPIAVLRCGDRVHPAPILGVMPDLAFLQVLRQRLAQLKKTSP